MPLRSVTFMKVVHQYTTSGPSPRGSLPSQDPVAPIARIACRHLRAAHRDVRDPRPVPAPAGPGAAARGASRHPMPAVPLAERCVPGTASLSAGMLQECRRPDPQALASVQSPHDRLFQFTFRHASHAAAWVRSVLPAPVATAIDWSTFAPANERFPGLRLRSHIADLV